MSNVTIMQKTVLWDNAHYTQNDNYALYVGALKEKAEAPEPWILKSKLNTHGQKQILNMYQSSLLKSEINCF